MHHTVMMVGLFVQPPEDREEEEELEDDVPAMVPQGWWGQLFQRSKPKTKKAPQKFGWIMGVLVSWGSYSIYLYCAIVCFTGAVYA